MKMADLTLEESLNELGLCTLIERFQQEKIESYMIDSLTDSDLMRLGVDTIGDRHRVRQTVTEKLKVKVGTAVDENEVQTNIQESNRISRHNLASEIESERALLFNSDRRRSKKLSRSRVSASLSNVRARGSKKICIRGWTHQFVCLASRNQKTVPNATEKEILNNAGLGKKKIKLNKDDDQTDVFEKIMSNEVNEETNEVVGFPQLREAGGFELLRSSQNCRDLKLIECSWTANELQKNVNPQATIYIRPIQTNLSTKAKSQVAGDLATGEIVKTQCTGCKIEFPVRELREHLEICDGSSNLHDTDDHLGSDPETDFVTTGLSNFTENDISEISTQISMPVSTLTQLSAQNSETIIYVVNSDSTNVNVDQAQSLPTSFSSTANASPIPVMNISTSTSVTDIANNVVEFCMSNSITDPVEILRKLQEEMVIGRPLEVEDITQCAEGDTNFILIDRNQTMATGFDEINMISDLRKTLEVQFYNEVNKCWIDA